MRALDEIGSLAADIISEDQDGLQQYAILPWRRVERLEILLITSRQSMRWVIPKGWPVPGYAAGETASQEAYEEAGIHGRRTAQCIGHYGYSKRLRDRGRKLFRVDVFGMEVTEVLESWPEADERRRQWFTPAEAAIHVYEPELSILIRSYSERQLEVMSTPQNPGIAAAITRTKMIEFFKSHILF
jgi:8-oxo-dGTP pyrophosphatase MutT (NUDIX family)